MEQIVITAPHSVTSFIRRHPTVAFFLLAYAGAWLLLSIPVLSVSGFGVLPIEIPPELFYILSAITGPTLAAFVITRVCEGKEGVRRLTRRILNWRAKLRWYLLSLLGVLAIYLLVATLFLGSAPWQLLINDWPIILTSYLPNTLMVFLIVSIWEEIGWTGFAAPKLQERLGPIGAAIGVGLLWALWHLPTYFLSGQVVDVKIGIHDLERLPPLLFNLIILGILVRVIMIWLSNRTNGNIIVLTLFHAGMNMTNGKLLPAFVPGFKESWLFIAFGTTALLLTILTLGRLSYKRAGY